MKIQSSQVVCGLSGRIYCTIEYLADYGDEVESIRDDVAALHPGIDREVIFTEGRWGYRVMIIKKGK